MKSVLMKNYKKILFSFFCATFLTFCSNDDGVNSAAVSTRTSLALSDVTPANSGCINIPLYAQGLHSLAPSLPVLRITKNVSVIPSSLPANFIAATEYAAFEFSSAPVQGMIDFDGYAQGDCNTLVYNAADGSQINYNITQADSTSLTASTSDGRMLKYTWLSAQSVQVTNRYPVYDLPCGNDSGFAEVTTIYDWSGTLGTTISSDSIFSIDPTYLQALASATGYDNDSLYEDDPDGSGNKVLVVANVEQMAALPIQQQLLVCGSDDSSGN